MGAYWDLVCAAPSFELLLGDFNRSLAAPAPLGCCSRAAATGGFVLWAFPGSGLLLGAAPALGRSLAVLWPLLGYSWAVALLLLLLGGFGVVFVSLWLFLGCLLV